MPESPTHLTDSDFDRYRGRSLPPGELLAAQRHLRECGSCRERLEGILIPANFRVDTAFHFNEEPLDPLSFEQLSGFADGTLDPVEQEIVESRLSISAAARADLADLMTYRAKPNSEATTHERTRNQPAVPFLERLKLWFTPGVRLQPATVFFGVLAVAALAVAGWTAFSQREQATRFQKEAGDLRADNTRLRGEAETAAEWRRKFEATQRPQNPDTPKPSSLTISDGAGEIALSPEGIVTGLDSLSPEIRKRVAESLAKQRLAVPKDPENLGGTAGTLLGSNNPTTFRVLSPVGIAVEAQRPVLRWKPMPGATGYIVKIFKSDGMISKSDPTTATEWTPVESLPRGGVYAWQVTALNAEGEETLAPAPPLPLAKFRVISAMSFEELQQVRREAPTSHLALAVAYANAGLVADARRELALLGKRNPDSTMIPNLIRSLGKK